MTTVNIVVTCSASKTKVPKRELTLRNLPMAPVDSRVASWIDLIAKSQSYLSDRVPVEYLYEGQHWSAVCSIQQFAQWQGINAHLWIASAGLGLVPWGAHVPSYSATFASGNPDSVSRLTDAPSRRSENRRWWKELSERNPLDFGEPRSIAHMASMQPRTPILLAISAPYLEALEEDAAEAVEIMSDKNALSILSVGFSLKKSFLTDYLLPSDARLQKIVGGSMGSLNARLVKIIIARGPQAGFRRDYISEYFKQLLCSVSPLDRIVRDRLSAAEIRDYVCEAIRHNPMVTHSGLLRAFRDAGYACESTRFRDLFLEVKTQHNGN